MYNVSIRSKHFEFITFNIFINLLILLKNCINYVQCKNIEISMNKYTFRYKNIMFSWSVDLHIYIKIKNLEYRKIFSSM